MIFQQTFKEFSLKNNSFNLFNVLFTTVLIINSFNI